MGRSSPNIPKKLSARISGAQAHVMDLGVSLIHNHNRRFQAQAELDIFHRNPEAYAADRWDNHVVDSSPVHTGTYHLADDVACRFNRIIEIERVLPDAEADVLAEVLAMRPSTGRALRPQPLPSFTRRIACEFEAQRRGIDAEPARFASPSPAQQEAERAEVRTFLKFLEERGLSTAA